MRPSSTISHAGGGDHAPEPEPMQPDSAIAITAHRFMGEGKASVAPAQAREAAWPGCSSDGQPLRIATARAKVIGSNDADESLHRARGAGAVGAGAGAGVEDGGAADGDAHGAEAGAAAAARHDA